MVSAVHNPSVVDDIATIGVAGVARPGISTVPAEVSAVTSESEARSRESTVAGLV